MNKTIIRYIFKAKIKKGGIKLTNGKSQPPKKKIDVRAAINKILTYSPKKKSANIIDEYSVLYPPTNSDSASGKSKGVLLVSAKTEKKKRKKAGKCGKIFHIWFDLKQFVLNSLICC